MGVCFPLVYIVRCLIFDPAEATAEQTSPMVYFFCSCVSEFLVLFSPSQYLPLLPPPPLLPLLPPPLLRRFLLLPRPPRAAAFHLLPVRRRQHHSAGGLPALKLLHEVPRQRQRGRLQPRPPRVYGPAPLALPRAALCCCLPPYHYV